MDEKILDKLAAEVVEAYAEKLAAEQEDPIRKLAEELVDNYLAEQELNKVAEEIVEGFMNKIADEEAEAGVRDRAAAVGKWIAENFGKAKSAVTTGATKVKDTAVAAGTKAKGAGTRYVDLMKGDTLKSLRAATEPAALPEDIKAEARKVLAARLGTGVAGAGLVGGGAYAITRKKKD